MDSAECTKELEQARARASLLEEKLLIAGTHLKNLATENAQLTQSAENNFDRAETLQRELEELRGRMLVAGDPGLAGISSSDGGEGPLQGQLSGGEAFRKHEEQLATLRAEMVACQESASERESALQQWAESLQAKLLNLTQTLEIQQKKNQRLQDTLSTVQRQLAESQFNVNEAIALKAHVGELEERLANSETTLQQLADAHQEELSQLVATFKQTRNEEALEFGRQVDESRKASDVLQAQLRISEEECVELRKALETLRLSINDADKDTAARAEASHRIGPLEQDLTSIATDRVEASAETHGSKYGKEQLLLRSFQREASTSIVPELDHQTTQTDHHLQEHDYHFQEHEKQLAMAQSEIQDVQRQFSQLLGALEAVANGESIGDFHKKGLPKQVINTVERLAYAVIQPTVSDEERKERILEEVRETFEKAVEKLRFDFVKVSEERDRTASELSTVLEKVAAMKETLTSRFQADQEKNEQLRLQNCELMAENETLKKNLHAANGELAAVKADLEKSQRELDRLRVHLLESHEAVAREALEREEEMHLLMRRAERAEEAVEEWEKVASHQKEEIAALDAQRCEFDEHFVRSQEDLREVVVAKDQVESELKNLQFVLEDFEMSKEADIDEQLGAIKAQLDEAIRNADASEVRAHEAERKLKELETDHPRMQQLEAELREKNALIGKLRHEAVLLNDDLAVAMRRMKDEMAENSVDRRLIANLFVQYFNAPLGDRKRWDIMELMASMLQFSEDEKEQVGLRAKKGSWVAPGGSSPAGTPLPASGGHVPVGESFTDRWISFLLSESSDRKGQASDTENPAG